MSVQLSVMERMLVVGALMASNVAAGSLLSTARLMELTAWASVSVCGGVCVKSLRKRATFHCLGHYRFKMDLNSYFTKLKEY